MSTESLWGNLDDLKKIKTPTAILREQGELLTASTNGVLEGRVSLGKHRYSGGFIVTLNIVAPTLNEYSREVLRVTHPLTFYPMTVDSDFTDHTIECDKEDDFINELGTILSSEEVRNIIQSLIAQSAS